jgi:hypothetical protein
MGCLLERCANAKVFPMKYTILKIIPVFALCLFCTEFVQAKDWRGIIPLKSTRADVERLLGKPNGLGRYEFDNERAYIHYAKGCDQPKDCFCLVPQDTVISIFVTLEGDLKLSELKIDLSKYKKSRSAHLPSIVNLNNDEEGITYTVDQEDEEIIHITYLPSSRDCQNLIYRARLSNRRSSRPLLKPRLNSSARVKSCGK